MADPIITTTDDSGQTWMQAVPDGPKFRVEHHTERYDGEYWLVWRSEYAAKLEVGMLEIVHKYIRRWSDS